MIWANKKQPTILQSMMEAEYISTNDITKEIV